MKTPTETLAEALLPCPFCGSIEVGDNRDKMDDIPATRIVCYICQSEGPWRGNISHTRKDQVEAWNRREALTAIEQSLAGPGDDEVAEAVEELRYFMDESKTDSDDYYADVRGYIETLIRAARRPAPVSDAKFPLIQLKRMTLGSELEGKITEKQATDLVNTVLASLHEVGKPGEHAVDVDGEANPAPVSDDAYDIGHDGRPVLWSDRYKEMKAEADSANKELAALTQPAPVDAKAEGDRAAALEAVVRMVDAWGNGLRHRTAHEDKMVRAARAALTPPAPNTEKK